MSQHQKTPSRLPLSLLPAANMTRHSGMWLWTLIMNPLHVMAGELSLPRGVGPECRWYNEAIGKRLLEGQDLIS